ncbi:DUF4167 domain-containing protein [Roseibium hamelinense]|uniref:DUF4167 domain-containing protein n=1 Tax=Roseibium hamelinense TaxID=150831 RepID=UPI0011AA2075|nr:DUF4167 domain-containing protein [Roseibium hamelinense]MTI42848.1 DUF4167 domain-containing protein [Roseibium hamelinense]
MRPGNQSNKRMRGRGRKGPNPLTRTYESNGPDVKIRGTALHVAEKYQQLARDAQASGDRIMSENYNQHAEHYLRIVAAAQAQSQPNQQVTRQDDEASDGQAANGHGNQNGSSERQRHERGNPTNGREQPTMVEEDSPQPFIESMPTIDEAGQLNGQAADGASADGASADADAGEEKPKRRARGTRSRTTKRTSEATSDDSAVDGGADVSAADDAGEDAKPKRRTTRPRRAKVAEAAPAEEEAVAAGE